MKIERIKKRTLDSLPEYSLSNPTGQVVGKVWKRAIDPRDRSQGWYICEYVEVGPVSALIDIRLAKVVEEES